MSYLLPLLYAIGLYSAYMAGTFYLRSPATPPPPRAFRLPWATGLLLLLVGVPSILQFFIPPLLPLFQRNASLFWNGEWWRSFTPLFFQDGGVPGTVFNLVTLLLVGYVAERIWGGGKSILIFLVSGIVTEFVALAWQPMGAGNSIANFGLAASVAMFLLLRQPARVIQVGALLALAADGVLLGMQDIHGAGALVGGLLALLLSMSTVGQ